MKSDYTLSELAIEVGSFLLSANTVNILLRNDIVTVEQLCSKSAADLRKIPGIGDKSVNDIVYVLQYKDLSLKPSPLERTPLKVKRMDTEDISNIISQKLESGKPLDERPPFAYSIDRLLLVIFGEEESIYKDFPFYVGTMQELQTVLSTLRPMEEAIIKLRFGLDDGHGLTLREIGEMYHLSSTRIMQIEAKALRKLRHPQRAKKLSVYTPTQADYRSIAMRQRLAEELMSVYPLKAIEAVVQRIKRPYLKRALRDISRGNISLQVRRSCGLKIRRCRECNTIVLPNYEFCSNECKKAYNQITVSCDRCGKLFKRNKGRLLYRFSKIGLQHAYCSLECSYKRDKEID